MAGKEIQGSPKKTMPEGNTTHAFTFSADSQVPLREALVGLVAALAPGRSLLPMCPVGKMRAPECPLGVVGGQ